MSGEEEGKAEEIDVEEAVSFFRALKDYFKENPKGLSLLLHSISENLIDEVNSVAELRKDAGFSAGQLEVVVDLIWNHDDEEVIQHLITDSPNLEEIMDIIAKLSFAYSKLKSNTDIVPGEIDNIIRDAATALYKILEYIITDTDSDP